MNPKSEKPLRLFNPFSIWTDIALKSGSAMLEAAQAAVSAAKSPKVALLADADADAPPAKPRRAASRKRRASAKSSKKSASARARRRGR